jgi:hypothetical protein
MNARLSCAALLALVCQPAWSQIAVEFDKSFVYMPAGTTDSIAVTHVKVPGLGNYNVRFKFNPATLAMDLDSATPSTTDDNTESLTGTYHCKRYGDSTPIFSTVIKPAGQNLVFGGAVEYVFYGISGSNNWKYIASLSDGGKYLLSVVKESATSIYALTGYIPAGQSSMDTNSALRCDKAS